VTLRLGALALAVILAAPAVRDVNVVAEDDLVRVLKVHWPPGAGQPTRPRPLRVVVYITDAILELRIPKRPPRVVARRAQTIEADSPDTFAMKNIGQETVEAIEIELKSPPSQPPLPDSLAEDPKHFKVIMDNRRLRILQFRLSPLETSAMHGHGRGVVVPLTPAHLTVELEDGRREERRDAAYQVRLGGTVRHSVANLENAAYEELIVELR